MDGSRYSQTIGKCVEIARAKVTDEFQARNLRHPEASLWNPDIDERLDFETVSPLHGPGVEILGIARIECHDGEALAQEGVVAVAEVCIPGSIEKIHNFVEPEVPVSPDQADVMTSPSSQEPRSLSLRLNLRPTR
jgi:hypothetical protein